MNELEKLMIAESKKNAIDDELIKDEQQSENDKADNWQQETMDKLRFLENYKCRLEEKTFTWRIFHPYKWSRNN